MKEIEDIIRSWKKAQEAGKKTALATVVHVEGSSYRRPGARMLVTEDGELTGAISGGCLEGDALRKALLAISQQQNKLVTYDTTDEDDIQFGVQLGCNGIVHILFEPIDPAITNHPVALLEKAMSTGKETVIVTLFSLTAYDGVQPGTCLLHAHGVVHSNMANPVWEKITSNDIKEVLNTRTSLLREYKLDENIISGLIELVKPPVSLIIVGAGNDALPLVKIANTLGWHTTIVDGRPGHANRQRFPDARYIITGKPAIAMEQIRPGAQTAFVLMTHNYNFDKSMLQLLLGQPYDYIGVLGPGRKLERMLKELEEETGIAITDAILSNIYGPTGLDIGSETAEEIALSIMAEIKMVLSARVGNSLRDKKGSIHQHEQYLLQHPQATGHTAGPVSCAITEQLSNNSTSAV